jgi:glycine/D-amino acid oxidase-like deaminating enzyme
VNQHDAVCDPVAMVNLLADGLRKTRIVESCEVIDLVADGHMRGVDAEEVHGGGGVRVRTSRGDVSASVVLVCTNAQASELITDLRGVVRPKRGQMVAVAPRKGPIELTHSYYLNRGDEYLRAGPGGVLLMGGARKHEPSAEEGDHGGVHPVVQERLEQWLRDLVTDDYQVVARWSGVMGFSPDGLPLVGPVDQGRSVWVCAGFTGHGMSLGFLTAAHAVNAILDGAAVEPMFEIDRI